MAETAFQTVLALSLQAGVFILLIALLRVLFKRAPHRVFVLLWAVAGLRLLVPVSIESPFSARGYLEEAQGLWAAGTDQPASADMGGSGVFPFWSKAAGAAAVGAEGRNVPEVRNAQTRRSFAGQAKTGEEESRSFDAGLTVYGGKISAGGLKALSGVWLGGAAIFFLCGVFRCIFLRRRLRDAVRFSEKVWQSDRIQSPFVLGTVRPRIYVPFGIEGELPYVLAHEQMHIKNGDHILKPLWYLLLSLYWFHPLVWLAYVLLGRDMELACDERVASNMNAEEKGGYARALFALSTGKRLGVFFPPAFGEVGVKMRIQNVLNYKKPAVIGAVLCLVIGIIFAVILLTEPDSPQVAVGTEDPGASQAVTGTETEDTQEPAPGADTETLVSTEEKNTESLNAEAGNNAATPSPEGEKDMDIVYFGDTISVDMDGDGKAESLTAVFEKSSTMDSDMDCIVVTVKPGSDGKKEVSIELLPDTPQTDRYYILNIDKGDSFVELGFYDDGPSDDPYTRLVRYAGGKLMEIGGFTANPEWEDTIFSGDGTVRAVTRCDILQTDWIMGTWRMEGGELVYQEPTEGEFFSCEEKYQSEFPVTAREHFTAHLRDPLSSAKADVKKGTKLGMESFVVKDGLVTVNFFYEEDGERILAYFQMEEPNGKVYLLSGTYDTPNDIFEGLSFAG
ncbi:MAG: hypothetical protein NC180_06340 [Muribaculaceae bacterium]|nr:hypothetical protein [Roseburia sp.]MCM1430847.1 hypothetical protein [Muribaculaceae bacterium]MCM1492826.1 hypothetical protein [Muribaculaceae bacterium]